MFGVTTQQQIPPEYLTSYAAWDIYMANVWSKLLESLSFTQDMTVVEVAPGTSTKIGLALKKHLFRGTLYLVEPQKSLLSALLPVYQALLPNATIYGINHTLMDSPDELPQSIDFLLSNHPLDDMLLSYPHNITHLRTLFDWTLNPSGSLSSAFLKRWLLITSDSDFLQKAKKEVIQQWVQFFNHKKPKITVISQYPSITFTKNNLHDLNDQASNLLHTLKSKCSDKKDKIIYQKAQSVLNQIENYNDHYIGTELLNIKNWLFFKNLDFRQKT